MYEPGEDAWTDGNEIQPETDKATVPTDSVGETDRVNGEYHYRNGYTQKIYSDAHYEPAQDTTAPTRYYTPPERTPRRQSSEKPKERKISFVGAICLCLICALLGGALGAGVSCSLTESRFAALEQGLTDLSGSNDDNAKAIASLSDRQGVSVNPVASGAGVLPAAQIYQQSCNQVVGITTTVTTTNFFGMTSSGAVSGSGFVISQDGYIITNYHVIEYADMNKQPVSVMLYDGTKYDAQIVGKEEVNDLAVLKINATGLTPVVFGDSDSLQVGDTVYAVGNPLGELEFSMSTGHVSALDRVVSTEESEAINMFQIDAAVNPGNSGGPVYNNRGEVIGVVTAKYSETGVEGIGFAIPINDAARISEDLVTKGYVTGKAYLGVWLDERYSAMVAQYYNMPLGAYINDVEKNSAADRAGIQTGDIITQIGDQKVESAAELRAAVRLYGAGDSAELTLYRAGKSMNLSIVFDEKTPESGTLPNKGE